MTSPSALDALAAFFDTHDCPRIEVPTLQPAAIFLDLSGEDIRRRLFITMDSEGAELCLRPEYTIPVCRQHIAAGRREARYSYLGPVYRQGPTENGEFLQAGIELIGGADREAADAEALSLALDGLDRLGAGPVETVVGDMGLWSALAAALAVPPSARRRIMRTLAGGQDLSAVLGADPRSSGPDYEGLLTAIEGQDPVAARAFVEDVISIAGIARVGGRSAAEIAERFLLKASSRAGGVSGEARDVLLAYAAIEGRPDAVDGMVLDLCRAAGLRLDDALDRFRRRNAAVAARAGETAPTFKARFARNLDYYTGFIFELRPAGRPDAPFLIAGGRYDRLLGQLGASTPLPAVGWSFWLDRLSGDRA